MTENGGTSRDEVRVRRAPRYSAFLVVGGFLGAVVAYILTASRPVDPEVGFLQRFLFLALFGVPIGMLLAGIAALTFERVYSRRMTTVTAERSEIAAPTHPPLAEPVIEVLPDDAQDSQDASGDTGQADPEPRDGPERTSTGS